MKRNHLWAAAIAIAIAAGALAGGTAALGTDDPGFMTASEVYEKGMTLAEVSAASVGQPGETAPPCPEAEVVTKLKKEGLPVGPCDPAPEPGAPVVLPATEPDPAPADDTEVCPTVSIRTGNPDGPNIVTTPCGPGAEIIAIQPATGERADICVEVTYRVAGDSPRQTATACTDDPTDANKPRALNKVG